MYTMGGETRYGIDQNKDKDEKCRLVFRSVKVMGSRALSLDAGSARKPGKLGFLPRKFSERWRGLGVSVAEVYGGHDVTLSFP
jgi:hypothetical protein